MFRVLERILICDPRPSEILVHIDSSDGTLERKLNEEFPNVRVLTSSIRVGPGGGRHKCLHACTTPYAVSFDDDSYPIDRDFFSHIERLFLLHASVAIFAAKIWHRGEPQPHLDKMLRPLPSYVGCGYAIRTAVYREMRGYLPRPVTYGIEENHVSLQLFAAGWRICESGELRVFHDTDLKHHETPEITSGSIMNVGLFAFLHYPVSGWGWGLLQLANKIAYCIRRGRIRGIFSGIISIPRECYQNRQFRNPVPFRTMRRYVRFSRTGVLESEP